MFVDYELLALMRRELIATVMDDLRRIRFRTAEVNQLIDDSRVAINDTLRLLGRRRSARATPHI